MIFELLLDVMHRFLNLRDAKLPWKELYRRRKIAEHKCEAFYCCAIISDRIGANTATDHIRLGGDGSLGVALSQALRARLRSYRPSGTFRNRARFPRHFVPGRLRRLRRARQPGVCATTFCGRAVGFAESGYDRYVPTGRACSHFATAFSPGPLRNLQRFGILGPSQHTMLALVSCPRNKCMYFADRTPAL